MSRPVLSEIPTCPVAVPVVVRALAAGGSITPVWRNVLGGLTFRIEDRCAGTRYAKWVAAGTPEIDLAREVERLAGRTDGRQFPASSSTVPMPTVHGCSRPRSQVPRRWPLAGSRTRQLPQRRSAKVSVSFTTHCPWTSARSTGASADDADVSTSASPTAEDRPSWLPRASEPRPGGSPSSVDQPPAIDRLVVCHGDACAPNTLLHDDGAFAAHVDLGSLGVADRWADLAVAAWSAEWNYGRGYDDMVYDAYGIAQDPDRIAYYRLLWDMA